MEMQSLHVLVINYQYNSTILLLDFLYVGWAMQLLFFIFLKRDKESNENYLKLMLDYYIHCKYPLQLLIFPEGTDLTSRHKRDSDDYARKNGLTEYNYVLHPRTKGFITCINHLREELKMVIDIDVAYRGPIPQNICDILIGKWPTEVHFRIRQYSLTGLPGDDDGLKTWLNSCWAEKEGRLEQFYKEGKFNKYSVEGKRPLKTTIEMSFILLLWISIFVIVLYQFYTVNVWFIVYTVATWLFFLTIDRCFGGFDDFVLWIYI